MRHGVAGAVSHGGDAALLRRAAAARDCAAGFGLPAATVRQHVHRGLALLRQQLDAEFGGREQWRGAFATLALGKTTDSAPRVAPRCSS
jgi:hypothetical protein